MSAQEENLNSLESMLDEFYGPMCTNERRKEIDDILSKFFEQQTCLTQALYFLSFSTQDYTRSFALNVLQACVCHNWPRYSEKERLELRYYTRQFLLENVDCLQYYVINKLCKLIADIARNEWPETDPDYFQFVMGLIDAMPTRMAGLVLLRSTFEEFISPKEAVSVSRKKVLSALLLQSVPNVLHFLMLLLQSSFENRNKKFEKSVATECLQAISQMLSWIPLENNINNDLIMTLLQYAQITQPTNVASTQTLVDDTLQLLAMDCVNEIMAKKCVPKDVEAFLLTIFHHTMTLLTTTNQLTEQFLLKLVYYLQLLMSSQFARLEAIDGFPMSFYLQSLMQFTFRQDVTEVYLACLDVWSELLDYLKNTVTKRDPKCDSSLLYRDTIVQLNSNLFSKIMFSSNQSVLDELDDETLDDDEETEYEKFQRLNLDIVVTSCDLYAQEILSALYEMFEKLLRDFTVLISCIEKRDSFELIIKAEYDNMRLHCKLRDLATASRLVGMVNGSFLGSGQQAAPPAENLAQQFVSGLLVICKESIKFSLFEIQGPGLSEALHSDFSNLLALSLGSLQLMTNWVSSFLGQAFKLEDSKSVEAVQGLTSDVFSMAAQLIKGYNSKRTVFLRLVSQIVFSHASTVKASFLLKLPSVQEYVQLTVHPVFLGTTLEIQCKSVQSTTLVMVSSWAYGKGHSSELQEWESRSTMFKSWVFQLFEHFHSISRNTSFTPDEETVIKRGLEFISHILSCLSGEVKKAREVCLESLQPYLEDVIVLCSNHFQNVALCGGIVDVFHTVLDTVKTQLGPEKTTLLIDTLMTQLTPTRVQRIFCRNAPSEAEVSIISKFIKTLMRIVEEPGTKFRTFLPSIIVFITESISPLICQENYYSPDCITIFLDLVFQIVNLHWSRFFEHSSNVSKDQFMQLVQIFGKCLLFPDVHVYKHAINALQRLNEVHNLYENALFIEGLQKSFVGLLLSTLVDKNQLMNEEEIILTIHAMVSTDFRSFHQVILLEYLRSLSDVPENDKMGLLQTFGVESDVPTFTNSLKQFVNDLNYVKLLNASLNEVSVNFTSLTQ